MKKPLQSEVIELENFIEEILKKEDTLSISSIAEISNKIFSFKPYRYLDDIDDRLNHKAYSPEKSQILIKLLSSNLDIKSWNRVKKYIPFNSLDIHSMVFMDSTDFSHLVMNGAKLNHSTCAGCNFNKAKLNGTYFEDAWLDKASFKSSFVPNGKFKNTSLFYANFEKAILNGSNFNGADLYHSVLDSAYFSHCDFRGADIYEISAKGTDFRDARDYKNKRFAWKRSGLSEEQLEQFTWEDEEVEK